MTSVSIFSDTLTQRTHLIRVLRRGALLLAFALLLSACSDQADQSQAAEPQNALAKELAVYKSPTCGCCQAWIDHATEAGFQSTIHHPADLTAEKLTRGIGVQYHSCHTAVSPAGYVFEGHIPAKLIEQFLQSPPENAIGLAVPGMPLGSPGMEVGDRFTPYDVHLLHEDGSSSVYAHVATAAEQY